jgi:hypothetical protein
VGIKRNDLVCLSLSHRCMLANQHEYEHSDRLQAEQPFLLISSLPSILRRLQLTSQSPSQVHRERYRTYCPFEWCSSTVVSNEARQPDNACQHTDDVPGTWTTRHSAMKARSQLLSFSFFLPPELQRGPRVVGHHKQDGQ